MQAIISLVMLFVKLALSIDSLKKNVDFEGMKETLEDLLERARAIRD